jgi:hypothetical protein
MAKKGSSLPHEERSYKDFYPDISITKEMEICKVGNNTKDLVHQFYISEPLPAVKVDFTKPIPKPKFDIIEHVAKPCAELPPFYHHIGTFVLMKTPPKRNYRKESNMIWTSKIDYGWRD